MKEKEMEAAMKEKDRQTEMERLQVRILVHKTES